MQATQENYQAYNNSLRLLANSLRHNATKAEACLWKYVLRAGQMKGYTFRRQRPVMQYIVDFMCQPLMLIIELDGAIHKEDPISANDVERQATLEHGGFAVLRFTNEEVLESVSLVRQHIEAWVQAYESAHGIPEKAGRTQKLRDAT